MTNTNNPALDNAQIIEMFEDILTIDSHFENVGYSGENVTLRISDLAKFIKFYQPATRPQPSGDADALKFISGMKEMPSDLAQIMADNSFDLAEGYVVPQPSGDAVMDLDCTFILDKIKELWGKHIPYGYDDVLAVIVAALTQAPKADVDAGYQEGFDEGFEAGKYEATEFDRDLRRAVFDFLEKREQIEKGGEYTAQDIFDALVVYEQYLKNTNKAPKADVEGLKDWVSEATSIFEHIIDDLRDNQDLSHKDFRIKVSEMAHDYLSHNHIRHLAAKEYLAPQVPEGYALVPIEPTGAMIMYGIHAHERNDDLPNIGTGPKCVGIWRAMLKAAPKKEE